MCIFDSRAKTRIQSGDESRSVQPFLDRTAAFRAVCLLTPSALWRNTQKRLRGVRLREGEQEMADLVLVYGMRLLPADEVKQVGSAPVALNNGNEAQVTMHVLEGSREQIENQLKQSIDAFFDFYPEI
jgi:hypothetical protein